MSTREREKYASRILHVNVTCQYGRAIVATGLFAPHAPAVSSFAAHPASGDGPSAIQPRHAELLVRRILQCRVFGGLGTEASDAEGRTARPAARCHVAIGCPAVVGNLAGD